MWQFSGKQIGKYRLIRYLGKGSFGEVYLAEHIHHKIPVAVKILYASLGTKNIKDFLTEAQTVFLEHPHIMKVKYFDVDNDRAFLVMDYAANGNLRQKYPFGSTLSWEIIVSYTRQVADALQYLHDQDMVHRDVKPENMLLDSNGEILLTDFGIATTSYTLNPNNPQEPLGTPIYMAPEQINSKAERPSDQYALGAIMYEWLSGTPPFTGTTEQVLYQHRYIAPEPLRKRMPTISRNIESVIMKMLSKNPKDRFASMRDFIATLDTIKTVPLPLQPKISIFHGHTEGVRTVAWSPNGMYVASAGRDKTVQVWETTTGHLTFSYNGHVDEIWSVTWSPDGRYIASASKDQTVQVWEATTGYAISSYDNQSNIAIYNGHTNSVHAVAWSPNGKYVASASDDKTVQIWEATTGNTVYTYRRHTAGVSSLAWSPNGKHIASSGTDMMINIWEVATGLSHIHSGHIDRVTSVAWSPDGKYIASASNDKTVQIWEASTGHKISTYTNHQNTVASVAWSPDNHYIVSGSWDKSVHVWEALTAKCRQKHNDHTSWVNSVAWSPDGRHIASGSWDKTVHIFLADVSV